MLVWAASLCGCFLPHHVREFDSGGGEGTPVCCGGLVSLTMSGWTRFGKTCQAEGLKLTKTSGGNYPRHATFGEVMTSGVHEWEVHFTSAASANGNRCMYIGVSPEGLDVEKGGHYKAGAFYIRTDDATLHGAGLEDGEQTRVGYNAIGAVVERVFQAGDRIGVKLNLDDGSLQYSKNGEPTGWGFLAGTIKGPVVGAVEMLCIGQALTLLPKATVLA